MADRDYKAFIVEGEVREPQIWLKKLSAYKKLASITVRYLDTATMQLTTTQMYIDGFAVKLVSDTSYGSLWNVSFTLKDY